MKFKHDILKLGLEGKSYNQIAKELGCNKATVCYHLGEGQKQKWAKRTASYKSKRNQLSIDKDRITSRIYLFSKERKKSPPKKTPSSILRFVKRLDKKIRDFARDRKTKMQIKPTFTREELLDKIGENPVCYLTGEPIDFSKNKSWVLDHIIPLSRGGSMNLDNANICSSSANQSKHALLNDEFFELCKKVLEYNGYNVSLKEKVQGDGFQPPSSSDAQCPIF